LVIILCGLNHSILAAPSNVGSTPNQGQFIDKHNYEITLINRGSLGLMTATARMIFKFPIPEIHNELQLQAINCTRYGGNGSHPIAVNMTVSQRYECENVGIMANAFYYMVRTTSNYLKQRVDQIHSILADIPTIRRRTPRGIGSDILSSITGLATTSEVHKLMEILNRVETGVLHASEAWKTGNSHYMAAFHIMPNRMTLDDFGAQWMDNN